MTVKDIIKAQEMCFLEQTFDECRYCKYCPLMEIDATKHCQKVLAEETIKKLKELTELLDDTVNHHYYETLECYQEENTKLADKLYKIGEILGGSKD